MKKLFLTMIACIVAMAANAWTVTFTNPDNWATVYVWAWNGSTNENFTGGTWPGAQMAKNASTGYWTFEGTGNPTKIIFSNNGKPQTNDLTFVDGGTYDMNGLVGGKLYDHVVYFENSNNWPNVYAYSWSPALCGDYPGVKLEKGSNGLYAWIAQTDTEETPSPGFQFNNGESGDAELKTPDITNYVEGATYLPNGTIKGEVITYPTQLYLVGAPNGWSIDSSDLVLNQTTEGVYSGTFNINADSFMFRFYSVLGDWETNSYGSQVDDNPINITFTNEQYNGPVVAGKGSWNYENWPGGMVTLKVDLVNKTVSFVTSAEVDQTPKTFYIVGSNVDGNSWSFSDNAKFTYNEATGLYTWEGSVLGTGFKISDSSTWSGEYNIGASEDGTISLGTPYHYFNSSESGDISFQYSTTIVNNPKVVLNIEDGTITLTGNMASLPIENYYLVGNFNGWTTADENYKLTPVEGEEGVFEGTFTIDTPVTDDNGNAYLNFKLVAFNNWSVNLGGNGSPNALYSNTPSTINLTSGGSDICITNWTKGEMSLTLNTSTNTLTLVTPDQPVWEPDYLWLVGNFTDEVWDIANQDYKLSAIGDGIYEGTFNIPAVYEDDVVALQMKVAASEDWADTYGAAEFALYSNQSFQGTMAAVGDNYVITNWAGGTLTVNVDWNTKTILFVSATQPEFNTNPEAIYLIGAPQGWDVNDGSMMLSETADGIYTGSFNIAANAFSFRFYTELGNWDEGTLGAATADGNGNYEVAVTNAGVLSFTGNAAPTKNNWVSTSWNGGKVNIEVNLNLMTVSFEGTTTDVELVAEGPAFSYANGVVTVAGVSELAAYSISGQVVARVNGESLDLNNLPGGVYVIVAPGVKPVKVVK